MIQTFISRRHTPDLVLFFAGWGMDLRPFAELKHIGCDCCICYDYTRLDFDPTPLLGYRHIEVYAWSFGVWAASMVLQHVQLPIRHATAINGTIWGIDAAKGIPPEIFQATLEHLDNVSLNKFYRRMCDDRILLKEFLNSAPNREIADLQTELTCIGQEIARNSTPHFHWDQAIVGNRDRIFPPENQLHAWQGDTKVQETDAAHYLHFRPIILERRLDKQVIRKCFERAVPTYEAEGCIQSCIAFRLNSLIPCAEEGRNDILEIGCGTGKLTRLLIERFPQARFTLNDLSPDMRSCVTEFPYNSCRFIAGDAESVEFDGQYDLIVSASTIQWFVDLEKFLQRIAGHLSENGTLAFSTFTAGNMPEIKTLSATEMPYWETAELKRLFEKYFNIDLFEEEVYQLRFDTPVDLLRHLKLTGVTGISGHSRQQGFHFIKRYREAFGEKQEITLSYCPVYIVAHKKQSL